MSPKASAVQNCVAKDSYVLRSRFIAQHLSQAKISHWQFLRLRPIQHEISCFSTEGERRVWSTYFGVLAAPKTHLLSTHFAVFTAPKRHFLSTHSGVLTDKNTKFVDTFWCFHSPQNTFCPPFFDSKQPQMCRSKPFEPPKMRRLTTHKMSKPSMQFEAFSCPDTPNFLTG